MWSLQAGDESAGVCKSWGCSVLWTLAPGYFTYHLCESHPNMQCVLALTPPTWRRALSLFYLYLAQTPLPAVQLLPSPFLLKSQCWFFIFYWDISTLFAWVRTSSWCSLLCSFIFLLFLSSLLELDHPVFVCFNCVVTDWAQWSIFNAFLIPFPIVVV